MKKILLALILLIGCKEKKEMATRILTHIDSVWVEGDTMLVTTSKKVINNIIGTYNGPRIVSTESDTFRIKIRVIHF